MYLHHPTDAVLPCTIHLSPLAIELYVAETLQPMQVQPPPPDNAHTVHDETRLEMDLQRHSNWLRVKFKVTAGYLLAINTSIPFQGYTSRMIV